MGSRCPWGPKETSGPFSGVSMHIKFRCTPCGSSSLVSFDRLCSHWKTAWENVKEQASDGELCITTEYTCLCGEKNKYKSPMFKYIFRIIFDEMLVNKDTM